MPINQPPASSHEDMVNRTRYVFIPAIYSDREITTKANSSWGMDAPDSVDTLVWGWGHIPADYVEDLSAVVIVLAQGSGDIRGYFKVSVAGDGDNPAANEAYVTTTTVAITGNNQGNILTLTFGGVTVSPGDIVRCQFRRYGSEGTDTLSGDLNVAGVLFSYTADM